MKKLKAWLYRLLRAYCSKHGVYINERITMNTDESEVYVPWLGNVDINLCNVLDMDTISFDIFHFHITISVGEYADSSPMITNQYRKQRQMQDVMLDQLMPKKEVVA